MAIPSHIIAQDKSLSGQHNSDYIEQWKELRKRERLFWGLLLGYIPGVIVLSYFLKGSFQSEKAFEVVAVLWLLFCAIAGIRLNKFPCPRCGSPFFYKRWFHNPYAKRCLHCELPKGAPKDPLEQGALPFGSFTCLKCGNPILKEDSACPKCRWSWNK
jgi:hypothetical protein